MLCVVIIEVVIIIVCDHSKFVVIYFIFGLFDHLLALSSPKESAQYTFTRALLHHQTQSNIFGLHTCFRTVQE